MVTPNIQQALETQVACFAGIGHPDLLARFILRNGTLREGAERPTHIPKMKDKECFCNATHLALENSRTLRYVEGYALSSIGMPVHHAWCETRSGVVVDPTWRDPALCSYMGVRLDTKQLLRWMNTLGVYGVLDTGTGLNSVFMFQKDPELEATVMAIVNQPKPQVSYHQDAG